MRRRQRFSENPVAPITVGSNQIWWRGAPYGSPTAYTYDLRLNRGLYEQQAVCLDDTHPGPPYRTGGGLFIFSWQDPGCFPVNHGVYTGAITSQLAHVYTGGFMPVCKWQNFSAAYSSANRQNEATVPGSVFPSESNAESYGATGWKRFRPGKPTADLGVFLGEFKDVPRMLRDTAKFFQNAWRMMGGSLSQPTKALSNHWLSVQFGWLPFVSDLRRFYQTYRTYDTQIQRIKRNNGLWQRRGGSIVEDTDTQLLGQNATTSGHWPTLSSAMYLSPSSTGNQTTTLVRETRAWFEGAFRYWIPDVESVEWSNRALLELYGAMPNPALVWELTPFSWLVDWCSNVGDVVNNMDTGWADNLAAKYAYVMKSVEVTGRFESTCALKSAVLHYCWDFPISWKTRAGASRFGFGLTDSDFTSRQWSILAALGIQRYR